VKYIDRPVCRAGVSPKPPITSKALASCSLPKLTGVGAGDTLKWMLDLSSIPELSEIVRRIVATAAPDRIVLFGSLARNQGGSESDLDIAVIKSGDVHRRELAKKIYRSLIGILRPVDILVLLPSDLEKNRDAAGSVVPDILRDGQEIYAA
jgi:predicted nucleotidyltransferase